jgi:putative two-component system response regulator
MNNDVDRLSVLVVDDAPENIDILKELLKHDYRVKVAINGEKALKVANSDTPPDIILLDVMMPKMDGYEVCEKLKSNPVTEDIPVIFLTALSEIQNEAKGLELGAVDYITKPFSSDLVKARVHNHLELKKHRDDLERLVAERTNELVITQEITIESMGTLAEYRDPETGGHIKRTRNYVKALAERLQVHPKYSDYLTRATIDLLHKSAPLHDIGKVGIEDSVLLKPGKLNVEEFNKMKQHTIYGRDTLQTAENKLGDTSFLHLASEIAYTHHEKWNGNGYPQGLKDEEIPISGRLMAIADVYDALISKRIYKPPFSHKKAVEIITGGKGIDFDPNMVDAFCELHLNFRDIALEFVDFDEERAALLS